MVLLLFAKNNLPINNINYYVIDLTVNDINFVLLIPPTL